MFFSFPLCFKGKQVFHECLSNSVLHFESPIILSWAFAYPSLILHQSCCCFPVFGTQHWTADNLRSLQQTSSAITSFSVGLWNCQSAVNKADFISGYVNHFSLELLALTKTWIKPENNATPAALSTNYAFSHISRHLVVEVGRACQFTTTGNSLHCCLRTGMPPLNIMQLW